MIIKVGDTVSFKAGRYELTGLVSQIIKHKKKKTAKDLVDMQNGIRKPTRPDTLVVNVPGFEEPWKVPVTLATKTP
jgi:hypothetical protein